MTFSRRTALRALGLSPLAAKHAADATVAELSGISPVSSSGSYLPSVGNVVSSGSSGDWRRKILRFVAAPFLPDWMEEEIRDRCRNVGYLDPDIACKRSWSMSVKIVTQRQRNVECARRDALRGPRRALRLRDFEDKFGVYL